MLVSICVLTYNSEATVIDTLDSIYDQTYDNIELIIADDASKDNTLSLVSRWIKSHCSRFVNVEIITVVSNTGTPANCNRAIGISKGEWIKLIAGDDCLLKDCIKDNVEFVRKNKDVEILYSNYYGFVTDENGKKIIIEKRLSKEINKEFDTTPQKQLKLYLKKGFNISPSVFINRSLIISLGGFIEKYKVFEDTPFFTKVLLANVKVYYLPKFTVMYRLDTSSVTRDCEKKTFYRTLFLDSYLEFIRDMVYPLHHCYDFSFWLDDFSFRLLYQFTTKVLKNKRNKVTNVLYLLIKGINPYYLFKKLL